MEYRRFGNTIYARIDRGEEILEQLKTIALREKIRLADVSALGGVGKFTVGAFLTEEKRYAANEFSGNFEIVSLWGTVNTMDGAYYAHLHMSAGDRSGRVFGGHLTRAEVGVTCEMRITVSEGTVDRTFDPETGVNLFDFRE